MTAKHLFIFRQGSLEWRAEASTTEEILAAWVAGARWDGPLGRLVGGFPQLECDHRDPLDGRILHIDRGGWPHIIGRFSIAVVRFANQCHYIPTRCTDLVEPIAPEAPLYPWFSCAHNRKSWCERPTRVHDSADLAHALRPSDRVVEPLSPPCSPLVDVELRFDPSIPPGAWVLAQKQIDAVVEHIDRELGRILGVNVERPDVSDDELRDRARERFSVLVHEVGTLDPTQLAADRKLVELCTCDPLRAPAPDGACEGCGKPMR